MSNSAAPSAPRDSATIPALDGLRGAAAIGVLLFHDGRLDGGFLGVDLFFALSGMLITGLLIDECRRTGTVDRHRFWSRRFRRLLPAMAAMLIAIVPMMRVWGSATQVTDAKHGVIPGLFYVSNWQQILGTSDYWDLFKDPNPLTHLWSLAVEGQFYVVWPLVVLLVAKLANWRAKLIWLTLAAIAASGALMWVFFDPEFPTRSYVGTDTRAASILLGALAAAVGLPDVIRRVAARRWWLVQATQVAIVAVLAWMWITVSGAPSWLFHGGFLFHSAIGAVLAASLGLARPTVVQRVFAWRPFRAAGLVSYGLYLWHWPVYVVISEDWARERDLGRWQLSLLRWSVTLCITVISYFLLELPIRHRTLLKGRWHAPAAFATAAAAIVAAVIVVPDPPTAPAAFDPGSIGTVPATTTTVAASTTTPTTTGSTVPGDTVPPPTTVPPRRVVHSVFWEGDSVAADASPGVLAALRAAGVEAAFHGYLGVGLTTDRSDGVILDPVLEERPDVVIWQFSLWDEFASPEQQRTEFDLFTDAVLGTGAALVFVTPPPTDTAKADPDVSVMIGYAKELMAERPYDVFFLDSAELWGPFAYDIDGDGVPDRKKDGVHVCPQGSARLGNWITVTLAGMFDGITPADPSVWANDEWVRDIKYNDPPGTCR